MYEYYIMTLLFIFVMHCDAQSNLSTGQIIGISVGVVMAVLLIAVIIFLICRRIKKNGGKKQGQLVNEGYENVASTTEIEKTTEKNFSEENSVSEVEAVSVLHKTPPVAEDEVGKSEASTQTKTRKVEDKQTGTKSEPTKISVSIQTIPQVDDTKAELEKKNEDDKTAEGEEEDVSEENNANAFPFPPKFDRMKSREDITFVSGWRKTVKLTELMKAKLILEARVEELEREEVTVAEIERELAPFLIGEYPIAGVIIGETNQKMSLDQAYKQNIITRGTAVSLLEAQAAVGSIIDPHDGQKMSVADAKERGLVDNKMASIIARAERAVTGFKLRGTNEYISLFQAMKRNLVVETHGIRLLEAQIATGGIIDPVANMRLPVEVAFERGLFDERLHRILEDPGDDTKGFLDPNTQENLTYLELIQRCVVDEETGHLLLPLVPENDRTEYMERHLSTSTSSRSRTFSGQTFSSTGGSVGAIEDVLEMN